MDFVKWGATAASASHYALVMWDHGGGSIGGFNLDNEGNKDAQSATRLYTSELASAPVSYTHLDVYKRQVIR